jgi:3-oxoacyl-[acyl-carrier protein] reductase
MMDLSDKTAIVTGGTRGIGMDIVSFLIDCGCEVIYTGTSKDSSMKNIKGRFEQLDLLDDVSVSRFTLKVMGTLKKIDILVNNAGINYIEPIDEICEENWERILKVNLTGAMKLIKAAANIMKKNDNGGKILNVSSIFGVVSKEKRNSYSASKTGLIGLTRSSALDLARYNILVNALCPGFTNTDLTVSMLSKDEISSISSQIPLGRFAKVPEIAKIAVFLVSDLNSYMTGQTVIADGGFTIR